MRKNTSISLGQCEKCNKYRIVNKKGVCYGCLIMKRKSFRQMCEDENKEDN